MPHWLFIITILLAFITAYNELRARVGVHAGAHYARLRAYMVISITVSGAAFQQRPAPARRALPSTRVCAPPGMRVRGCLFVKPVNHRACGRAVC